MSKLTYLIFFSFLLMFSCSKEEIINSELTDRSANQGVINHVSVGSNDACSTLGAKPGCDKSFSLTAIVKEDGSVSGQWVDGYKSDNSKGIHVSIDCVSIIGNSAVIGGIITKGTFNNLDVTGFYAMTAVVDNGTSSKDPLDQISFSYVYATPRIVLNL
ncbi:MAG: hypothetical protein IPL23_25715 [Saprospiraceae bacterium]|nr:hypothetical protein [Saprospiraceae bacterium]